MIIQANAFQIPLKDESVQCIITSPPYWGLRDYGLDPLIIGENNCVHEWGDENVTKKRGVVGGSNYVATTKKNHDAQYKNNGQFCLKCNAWRGCLGLEPTLELYLEHMVTIFREVGRVLRPDGVLLLNIGDSYVSGKGRYNSNQQTISGKSRNEPMKNNRPDQKNHEYLKDKDLAGIPWRLAFALQKDGWWLRSDNIEYVKLYCPCGCGYELEEFVRYSQDREIIWEKPNPMPESCTDRPTKSHEYIFLLTKSAKYFWDAEGIREKTNGLAHSKGIKLSPPIETAGIGHKQWHKYTPDLVSNRNARSVWTIATEPFPDAHFATFPTKLVARCIKAGTSEKGCCVECGVPWERIIDVNYIPAGGKGNEKYDTNNQSGGLETGSCKPQSMKYGRANKNIKTIGWQPTCICYGGGSVAQDWSKIPLGCDGGKKLNTKPCVVFDPFGGSGTVLDVANRMGRKAIVMDLKWEYLKMAQKRCIKSQEELAL